MEAFRNEEIAGLLGDFYQAHANENREVMEQSLMKMQNLLYTGEADSTPFKDYFNSVFGGRTPYNASLSVSDYPKESIIRELLQNTFGCYYSDPDIKVLFNSHTTRTALRLSRYSIISVSAEATATNPVKDVSA